MSIDDGRAPAPEQDTTAAGTADAGVPETTEQPEPPAAPEAAVEAPAPRTPAVGDIVLYQVSDHDEPNTRHNAPKVLPAVVTAVWGPGYANLKIITDGPVNVWKSSVQRGDGPGHWDFRD